MRNDRQTPDTKPGSFVGPPAGRTRGHQWAGPPAAGGQISLALDIPCTKRIVCSTAHVLHAAHSTRESEEPLS